MLLQEMMGKYKGMIREIFIPLRFDEHIEKGTNFWNVERPDIARSHFSDALSLQPQNSAAWSLYGLSLLGECLICVRDPNRADQLGEIVNAFTKAAELEPSADNFYNLAEIYRWTNQLDESSRYLNKALEANPNDGTLFMIIRDMESTGRYHMVSKNPRLNLRRINVINH